MNDNVHAVLYDRYLSTVSLFAVKYVNVKASLKQVYNIAVDRLIKNPDVWTCCKKVTFSTWINKESDILILT